ncbi:MAG: UDP-N-acetylglucosamine--N-acetylmuramyl-(pentapeptide) pyrophosphoryl-undecaprenol N-acetylglucosamine transferase, partial [Actinomycetota bacterium]|nr:UDP-N-acetylglucosamine--N-acetylmuramyl-(pentapeptide) pyrophosphoryl-undecaprenol N-acetylglucosamine transferase [Actinomycetota bacterium]
LGDIGAAVVLPQTEFTPERLAAELRAFVEHVQGGPPPLSSAADAVVIVEAVAAMIELAGVREGVAG